MSDATAQHFPLEMVNAAPPDGDLGPGRRRDRHRSGGTGGTADRKNTLEQVLLATPAAGTYTVTVRSFNVPNGPQPFSLVVTGNVTGP